MKTEAETGVMWPQAKECQEPPETGGGREGFSPRDVGRPRPPPPPPRPPAQAAPTSSLCPLQSRAQNVGLELRCRLQGGAAGGLTQSPQLQTHPSTSFSDLSTWTSSDPVRLNRMNLKLLSSLQTAPQEGSLAWSVATPSFCDSLNPGSHP